MDPKLFHERLAEFAELRPMKPPTGPAVREAAVPEEIIRNGHKLTISKKDNPSWPYEVKKLKTQSKKCQHCDRVVKDQVISIKYLNYPEPHRRESCNSCLKTLNPETGKFDLTSVQAPNFFATYFRKKNK